MNTQSFTNCIVSSEERDIKQVSFRQLNTNKKDQNSRQNLNSEQDS